MQAKLLSLAAIAATTASMAAQCVAPSGPQTLETVYQGTTFYSANTPPNYGVSLDPGVAIRFDLSVSSSIDLTQVGSNFLNDGGTYAGIPCPNLVGAPNGTCEVWVVPNNTVNNAALFTNNPYTHIPSVPPIAPWTLLSNQATHLSNLVFAAPDTPSLATFNPPLSLAPGNYAVCLVFVPRGVATLPAGTGTPANPATDRIHPLFTNMTSVPTPTTFTDGFLTISNPGVQSPAFANGALSPASIPTAYMPNFTLTYTLGANVAYATPFGTGCYVGTPAFYESWVDGAMDIDAQGSIHGLDLALVGGSYLVTRNITPGLLVAPGSSVGAVQLNTLAPLLTTGGWDDALAAPITMPFSFPHAADPVGSNVLHVSSNGIAYFASATNTFGFYDDYAGFLANRPGIAAAWCDYEPADLHSAQGGTGNLWYDTDNATYAAVTWQGVQTWNEPTNLSTVQLVLGVGGSVRIRYGATGIRSTNAPVLVGYTPGNGAADPGTGSTPRRIPDFSAATAAGGYLAGVRSIAAELRLGNRPRVGSPLVLRTSNIDPTVLLNATLISTSSLPGPDLASIGMPGCNAYVVLPGLVSNLGVVAGGVDTWNALAVIPPAFAGVDLFAQSVQFATGFPVSYNAANLLVSNGVCIHFDAF